MLIDFHTHLHAYETLPAIVACIEQNAILQVACSEDIDSYEATREMGRASGFIIPTFGIHPRKSGAAPADLGRLDPYLDSSAIIGETGMDDYWFREVDLAAQERVFTYILDHCEKQQKYCVIHTKGAEERICDILAAYKKVRPVIHWYSGPLDVYKKLLARRYYVTFGCEVYYSPYIRELLSLTPPELILSETDNPSSEPWLGGATSSPLLIRRVVDDIARVKNRDREDMEAIIQENAIRILSESNLNRAVALIWQSGPVSR
jgi:TatD DNase family protein